MSARIAYLATPMTEYASPRYDRAAQRIKAGLPAYCWIEPALMGWSTADWLRAWQAILPRLDLLVVLPRADGTVGRGVWQEYCDARAGQIPVLLWHDAGVIDAFELARLPGDDWIRYAIVQGVDDARA